MTSSITLRRASIIARARRVKWLTPKRWAVSSASTNLVYLIDLEKQTCTCRSNVRPCKHFVAVLLCRRCPDCGVVWALSNLDTREPVVCPKGHALWR